MWGVSVRGSVLLHPAVNSVTFDPSMCALIGWWEGSGGEEGPICEHRAGCARGDASTIRFVSGMTRSGGIFGVVEYIYSSTKYNFIR